MTDTQLLLTVLVIAAVTAALRFIPFFVFSSGKKTPDIILYLGKFLPYAIMAMLVVYCLKNVNVLAFPFGLPELIGVLVAVLLHLLKRNTLLSIIGSTACYMLLIQFVF
ncbi:MAG: branched-chain amino acid transporter AzlD [Ruminococcaceae bacterium]|nr:branched-chain amino acid transporter AzlD [Oscillospiraceae bacterium]